MLDDEESWSGIYSHPSQNWTLILSYTFSSNLSWFPKLCDESYTNDYFPGIYWIWKVLLTHITEKNVRIINLSNNRPEIMSWFMGFYKCKREVARVLDMYAFVWYKQLSLAVTMHLPATTAAFRIQQFSSFICVFWVQISTYALLLPVQPPRLF